MSSAGGSESEAARPVEHAVRPGDPTPEAGIGWATGCSAPDGPTGRVVEYGHERGRGGGRFGRIALLGVALLAGVAVLYFLVTLAQVWTTGRNQDAGPADAIVVMGAAQYDGRPSPQLAARLDHVLEIWPDDVAPLVVVTGGNIPGDRFTEAEASATYLAERGIPESALLLENAGSNTYESLAAVSDLLTARGMDEVIIVTDPDHALRSRLIAEEVGLDASVSSTQTSVVAGSDSFMRHLKEAGGVAAGRIIGFERLTELVD